ncbi:MAG: PadR family transcriptional regulator [Defluviitaleaceae bacterium]|nr:PadR family transcriptional regulator [Defluviitaleaceae bacterium]
MPKQDHYQQGQLTDVAYLVLASLTIPCHGYLIMSKIEEMTDGNVRIGPASLYTTLKKLTNANFIRLIAEDEAKKIYYITDEGLSALKIEIDKRERYAAYGKWAISDYKEGNLWQETIRS